MRAIVRSFNTNQMLNLCPQNEWAYWETEASLRGHSTGGKADWFTLKQHGQDKLGFQERGSLDAGV